MQDTETLLLQRSIIDKLTMCTEDQPVTNRRLCEVMLPAGCGLVLLREELEIQKWHGRNGRNYSSFRWIKELRPGYHTILVRWHWAIVIQ